MPVWDLFERNPPRPENGISCGPIASPVASITPEQFAQSLITLSERLHVYLEKVSRLSGLGVGSGLANGEGANPAHVSGPLQPCIRGLDPVVSKQSERICFTHRLHLDDGTITVTD